MLMEKLRNTSDYSRCVNAKIEKSLLLVSESEIQVKPSKLQRYVKHLASKKCNFLTRKFGNLRPRN